MTAATPHAPAPKRPDPELNVVGLVGAAIPPPHVETARLEVAFATRMDVGRAAAGVGRMSKGMYGETELLIARFATSGARRGVEVGEPSALLTTSLAAGVGVGTW